MATPQEQGTAFIAWGVVTAGINKPAVAAFITNPLSADYSLESEQAEARNNDGEIAAYSHYNPSEKVTVTGYAYAATPAALALLLPAIGDVITPTNASHSCFGQAFSVAGLRIRETNTDWTALEVDLYRKVGWDPA